MQVKIITNKEVNDQVDLKQCITELESAYRELGEGDAIVRPRTDLYMQRPQTGNQSDKGQSFYVFKSMEGLLPSQQVVALRINSDSIRWISEGERIVKQRVPSRSCFTLLFDTETGDLAAIIADEVIERMRVGATTALAAKYLARSNSTTIGVLGSGGQARTALRAMATLFPLEAISVYSPDVQHRKTFAAEMTSLLGTPVRDEDSAEKVVRDKEIVIVATSAIGPLLKFEWLAPGCFVSCVKSSELGDSLLARMDQVVVHFHQQGVWNFLPGGNIKNPVVSMDPGDMLGAFEHSREISMQIVDRPDLSEVVTGKVNRRDVNEKICFLNNIGTGLQFAAVGAYLLRQGSLTSETLSLWDDG